MKKYALVSVSDEKGIHAFVADLRVKFGYGFLSTKKSTETILRQGGPHSVVDISRYTGFPDECLDWHLTAFHTKIHGGILFERENPIHEGVALEHGFADIDIVVVDLILPKTEVINSVASYCAIEKMNIGEAGVLRSAAANHKNVTAICDPRDYNTVIKDMDENGGKTSEKLRLELAAKAFEYIGRYDMAIGGYLRQEQVKRK